MLSEKQPALVGTVSAIGFALDFYSVSVTVDAAKRDFPNFVFALRIEWSVERYEQKTAEPA
jgi:hypothetical protein